MKNVNTNPTTAAVNYEDHLKMMYSGIPEYNKVVLSVLFAEWVSAIDSFRSDNCQEPHRLEGISATMCGNGPVNWNLLPCKCRQGVLESWDPNGICASL